MKPLHEKAYHQSGSELLDGRLDPSCYASSLAEANGDATLAMGLYAKKRARLLADQFNQAYKKDRDRIAAMNFELQESIPRPKSRNTITSISLCLILFLGVLSVITALFAGTVGKVSAGHLAKFVIIATLASASAISLAGWIFHLCPRFKFVKVILVFTTLVSALSFASGIYLVKKSSKIEWVG